MRLHGQSVNGAVRPVLEFENLGLGFGPDPVSLLEQVNLHVFPGEIVAIRGDNGGGKSCLLRMALGLFPPRVGQVKVFGSSPRGRDHVPEVGFVGGLPQGEGDLPLPPDLPVRTFRHVIMESLRAVRVDSTTAIEYAEMLGLDDPTIRHKTFGQLSKGWQLRHQLWAAFAKPVRLLLLDEPFDGLDQKIKPIAFKILERVVENHRPGVLLVSHHYSEIAESKATRVYELANKTLQLRAAGRLRASVVVNGNLVEGFTDPVSGIELLGYIAELLLGEKVDQLTIEAERQTPSVTTQPDALTTGREAN